MILLPAMLGHWLPPKPARLPTSALALLEVLRASATCHRSRSTNRPSRPMEHCSPRCILSSVWRFPWAPRLLTCPGRCQRCPAFVDRTAVCSFSCSSGSSSHLVVPRFLNRIHLSVVPQARYQSCPHTRTPLPAAAS